MGVFEFFLSACTDLAFVPALVQVFKRRRHFELFIGVFQLFAAFMYNCSEAMGVDIFIRQLDWHLISDVMTLSYVCCLLVHIRGSTNENMSILLRYLSFSLAWVLKLRDSWDSAHWEAGLVIVYLLIAGYGAVTQSEELRKHYRTGTLQAGAGFLACAGIFFFILEATDTDDDYGVLRGVIHCFAAAGAYCLWKGIPSLDSKKFDGLPSQSSSNFV
uniref:Intimal thickness related receptor IRP domain-containing protein n=1 Tax=Mucochytrium quahogii TaxID=96639 RepID=A0A7S2WQI7_9STRA|mmetsp:Transcript_16256/g.26510  ORF Transcript_16256/g.26510 Transcript_16256/m.26510 type:complete len:216 (-) Transcript_16256:55-702(-)|eukprot:CAMPEP_0203744746 /NCGR_PEP_ID=MMETSP0098-20131031/715_1 /ASSEMBLY_ACC=CAM_ASM_000208 /TAXON_ID=96639 /ORGANISM=" , Strain NY0313808BC1" /LENGTH=215 /DNA_ID=CAMNT_0050632345 /DNA_START=112 /DNA_END=759 /DNA_ORIENTATION=+